MKKTLYIHGTYGLPARHGGFESFAQALAEYLITRGWDVTVYGQDDSGTTVKETQWNGINCISIPSLIPGTTIRLKGGLSCGPSDLLGMFHARRHAPGVWLTLGYNTALFNLLPKIWGCRQVINMDGIEWKREKWSLPFKAIFWINERIAAFCGDMLVADHPKIAEHTAGFARKNKIVMIPYGAPRITQSTPEVLQKLGVEANQYSLVIARPEPENNILTIVKAWAKRKRDHTLVVLGNYNSENAYHRAVKEAASPEVIFPGAIYDPKQVQSLRVNARFYIHGHTVGGTNPSLVEALGAGNPVLAHDNPFNRWVAGPAGRYFADAYELDALLMSVLHDYSQIQPLMQAALERHEEAFEWPAILQRYEQVLEQQWQAVLAKKPRTPVVQHLQTAWSQVLVLFQKVKTFLQRESR